MGVMGIYGWLWMSVGFWVSMGTYGCLSVFMGVYECRWLWIFMWIYGCLWVSMSVYGFLSINGYL